MKLVSGDQVYESVLSSWTSVVEAHQAGLSEPGQPPGPGLSSGEAWHHYQAGQAGVVDSARLLITFSLVTSVQTGGEPLHLAASLGDLERVRQLLEDGVRVDSVKEDGNTALHCASIMGHTSVVELLIEEEADLEATGNSGATPLMMAASMGHLAAVQALLEGGAQSSKLTPLPVDLERIVARGRFGAVWKGRVRPGGSEAQAHAAGEGVAVKIFQQLQQDRNSWNVAREIFELPRMEHDNILKFMGVDIKDIGGRTEYWLMTKFHDNGK